MPSFAERDTFISPEHEWDERWSNRALQSLGKWLTRNHFSDSRAASIVESVWVFASYTMALNLDRALPIGLGAVAQGREKRVILSPPSLRTAGVQVGGNREEMEYGLKELFQQQVAAPFQENPVLQL